MYSCTEAVFNIAKLPTEEVSCGIGIQHIGTIMILTSRYDKHDRDFVLI